MRSDRDWSLVVCSSDLTILEPDCRRVLCFAFVRRWAVVGGCERGTGDHFKRNQMARGREFFDLPDTLPVANVV